MSADIAISKALLELVPEEGMQTKALECPADEMFLGGQAGPGKSWVLLYADIEDAIKYPVLRVLFLRRQMPELADLLQKAIEMYTPLGARFYSQHPLYKRPAFVFPKYSYTLDEDGNLQDIEIVSPDGGAVFVFGHMSQEVDKYAYGGFEWTRINWDELPNFLESQYNFMWSRLRTAKIPVPTEWGTDAKGKKIETKHELVEIKTKMRSTGNPVGIGMLWVKRRFIDVGPPETIKAFIKQDRRDVEVPIGTLKSKTRVFIPGIRSQNRYLGDDYEGNLAQMDSKMYEALALGKWEISDSPGQLISGKWLDYAMSGKVRRFTDPILMEMPAVAFDYATDRGADKSVLMSGRGNSLKKIRAWPYTRQDDAAFLVTQEASLYGLEITKVGVDGNGAGHGVIEKLESGVKGAKLCLPEKSGWVVDIPIVPNLERCVEVDRGYSEQMKAIKKLKFPNFRSQMYWQLKTDFEEGNIDLSGVVNDQHGSAEFIEALQEELMSITYEERNGMIYIIKKEDLRHADRLGRSPDFADCLAIWNWVRQRTRPKPAEDDEDEFEGDYGGKKQESIEEKYSRSHF